MKEIGFSSDKKINPLPDSQFLEDSVMWPDTFHILCGEEVSLSSWGTE